MSRRVVISLCDLTGNFVAPWVDAGCRAILVDPQHGTTGGEGSIFKMALTVESALPHLRTPLVLDDIAFVAAFPPCTDLAVSGTPYWARKRDKDYMFQAKAAAVAEQCRTFARLTGAPNFIENPVSALRRVFGKADHTFHPYEFTGLEPGDNYTKRTCLWTGGGFVMPVPQRDPSLGEPDDRIHKAPPSAERGNFRSATPMGFARAVFQANAHLDIHTGRAS